MERQKQSSKPFKKTRLKSLSWVTSGAMPGDSWVYTSPLEHFYSSDTAKVKLEEVGAALSPHLLESLKQKGVSFKPEGLTQKTLKSF